MKVAIIEKPSVPQIVADWLESLHDEGENWYTAIGIMFDYNGSHHDKPIYDWFVDNKDEFIIAAMYGYKVEKEKIYYAKNKLTGQYLGNGGLDKRINEPRWATNDWVRIEKLTKAEFEDIYGLNDTNADFEEVEDVENEVREEPKYYARIKGWELIADERDIVHWMIDKQKNGLFVGELPFFSIDLTGDYGYVTELTADQWNELGVYDDVNAVFISKEEG